MHGQLRSSPRRSIFCTFVEFAFVLLSAFIFCSALVAQVSPDADKETAFHWVDENADTIRKVSLNIWNSPEIALHEFKSSRELMAFLESNGFRVEKGVANLPTAFIATYGTGRPVVALYGEYDALPGLSQNADSERRPIVEGGPGHGCGHNLIGTGAAAAAIALSKLLQAGRIKGTLRYYGTPAEESEAGKSYMLEAGLFDDVDALLGWHPQENTWAGFQYSKAAVSVHFIFTGVSAYAGNSPQVGRSALKGAELLEIGVNFMREHVKDDVRISSVIATTATQPSVVPANAESWYQLRTNKYQDLTELFDWVSDIAKGAALMTHTQVTTRIDYDTRELLPNLPLAQLVDRNLRLVGMPQFTDEDRSLARKMQEPLQRKVDLAFADSVGPLPDTPKQGFFFTDVGNVSWKVPSQVFEVSSYPFQIPIHTWQVAASAGLPIGQRAMIVAAKTLAGAAIDLFKDQSLLQAAKKDFAERSKGYTYRPIAPPNRKPPIIREGS
jgi:aminobenzoyl-glutamate utilization protein B